jgi:putative aldouronate transport system substrate-binding protein
MKFRKTMALLLVLAMGLTTFVGCSKSGDTATSGESAATSDVTTDTAATETKDEATDTSSDTATESQEIVTLKWIQVGGGMPTNYDAWQKNINEYLGEKIGVNIDVEVVSWGDWDNRRSVIVNSGEYFDILFTDSGKYNSEVGLGAFLDISDLIKTASPDLYSYIPQEYWDAVSVNGKIYSVPTYKDSSATQYMVWDKAIVDKYNIDYANLHSFADLTDTMKAIKDGEGTTPYILDKNGADVVYAVYDQMSSGLPAIGVRYDDESRKVVCTLEQEDILSQLDVIYDWYNEGIINADAPTLGELPSYRTFFTAQGWSKAAETTWGPNMGVEAVASQMGDTIVSNSTVRGSLNGIYSGSKYPEKCLEFLQLVNLDSKVRDAFYYGLEGENFNYTSDGKIEKINSDWNMAGYTQGTFFNVSQLADTDFNQWDEVKELNSNAVPSVLLGFNLDTSKIETELANCRAIYEKYGSMLLTGSQDPRELAKTIKSELDTAGLQTVINEAQAQIDAMYK